MKKAMLYGLLASMFFALTFILNRSMNLGGRLLAVERFPAVSVHAADSVGNRKMAERR